MLSIYRSRGHLGIGAVSFSAMLRTPWDEMPKASTCEAVLNGERQDRVCPPREFEGTLLQRYVRLVKLFAKEPKLTVSYDDVCSRPLAVLKAVELAYGVQRGPLVPCGQTKWGWGPVGEEPVEVSVEDYELMQECQYASDAILRPSWQHSLKLLESSR